MREDLPFREGQGLRPAAADGAVPERWARSVNQACTAWLLRRGLLAGFLEESRPLQGMLAQERAEGKEAPR